MSDNGKGNNGKGKIPSNVLKKAVGDLEAMEGIALQSGEKSRFIRKFNSGDTRMNELFNKYPGLRFTYYPGTVDSDNITFGSKRDSILDLAGIIDDDSNSKSSSDEEFQKNHDLDYEPSTKRLLKEAGLLRKHRPNDSDEFNGPPGKGPISVSIQDPYSRHEFFEY